MHCPFGFLFVWLYVCVHTRVETIFQWEGQCVCVFQMDGKKIKLVELMNSGNISLLFPEPLFIQILSVVYFWEYVWEKKDWFIIWFYYWFYLGKKGINLSITSFFYCINFNCMLKKNLLSNILSFSSRFGFCMKLIF